MFNVTYNLVVRRESTPLIRNLIHDGLLSRTQGEYRQGASGPLYAPSSALLRGGNLHALSDSEFRFGPAILSCQAYTLPPEEYRGLMLASPAFSQFDVQPLHAELCTGWPEEHLFHQTHPDWNQRLIEAVRRGPRLNLDPVLVSPTVQAATWLPEETRLSEKKTGWMLSLGFAVPDPVQLNGVTRSAAGIDLGLRRLTVAVHESGLIHAAPGIPRTGLTSTEAGCQLPNPADQQQAQWLNLGLQYAAARTQLHDFLTVLLSSASSVGYEDLDYDQMSPHFQQRSRELGLRDFSYVWLPKRLKQAGIQYEKLPARHTSQICSLTHLRGTRGTRQRDFLNGNNEWVDADENAARNIMRLHLASQIWGKPK
ncbi:hypothetical protein EHF33_20195 (plasmid) [Deinococcus psychrotolerans]|uniref:Cas12f1-like TNB domain-containing protein n=1 Tax=Deinococcus psychrotolerans TaxID=2489213 RepID=A0A3G8YJW0_9DEIO|nr:hypothetical protein [Deinococcus psychrotolerans]AZI45233.1 hypothetical protein EHF33_20195 [Deinococcus psychrotolerans]